MGGCYLATVAMVTGSSSDELCAGNYRLLTCDLRDTVSLDRKLKEAGIDYRYTQL